MGKGDDPNRSCARPMPAPDAAEPTERQQRKLAGLRRSHPGLIEYGPDDRGRYAFAVAGTFKARAATSAERDAGATGTVREYRTPVLGLICADGQITWPYGRP